MKTLSAVLAFLLCIEAVRVPAYAQSPPVGMHIVIVDGEGAINNIGQRTSRDPVVRVEDEAGKPVSGASVVFTLPTEGASGVFGNGEKTLIVTTDPRGQAVAAGLKVNEVAGRLQIHINASYRGQTARANMTQFNMAVPGKHAGGGSGKTILILLAIGGAAAAGGAVFALRGRNGSPAGPAAPPTPAPIGITPGTGTVGPPR